MTSIAPTPADQQESIESRILDAAMIQFGRVGVKKTTIEDIARQAGVDRVTVYRRIGSRDDVVQATMSREVATVLTEIQLIPARHDDIGDLIADMFVTVITRWREHTLVQRMLTLEPERVVMNLTVDGATSFGVSVVAAAAVLQTAADDGLLSDNGDLQARAELICRIVQSFILGPEAAIRIRTRDELDTFARTYLVPIVAG